MKYEKIEGRKPLCCSNPPRKKFDIKLTYVVGLSPFFIRKIFKYYSVQSRTFALREAAMQRCMRAQIGLDGGNRQSAAIKFTLSRIWDELARDALYIL